MLRLRGRGIADAVESTAMLARSVILATALGACAGSSGNVQPTVMPRLDSLPDEHVAREERLDSAAARPGPETQKPKSAGWRRAETAAATAAAIVGSIFSTTKTVTVGVSGSIDENELVDPGYGEGSKRKGAKEPEPETYDPNQLTPWVRLGVPDPE